MGAKILGLKALLVDPVSLENERGTVKFRRFLMKGFRKRIEARKTPFKKEENSMNNKILLLLGPNLNMVGVREKKYTDSRLRKV